MNAEWVKECKYQKSEACQGDRKYCAAMVGFPEP